MLLMLIDTRGLPPEPEDDDDPEGKPWPQVVQRLLQSWPAVMLLAVVASLVAGWIGFALACIAAGLGYRRLSQMFPARAGGLRDFYQ
jgi:hypothetical protein